MNQTETEGLREWARRRPLAYLRDADRQIVPTVEHLHHRQQQKEPCRDGLDQRIAEGNPLAAVAAATP